METLSFSLNTSTSFDLDLDAEVGADVGADDDAACILFCYFNHPVDSQNHSAVSGR